MKFMLSFAIHRIFSCLKLRPNCIRLLLIITIFCAISRLQAQVPLYSLQTKNLRLVYYDQSHSYLLPHMARCFENSLRFHRALFNYTPTEEVTILVQDFNDYGSAGTNTIPWNFINVCIEPFDYVYETSPTNERMNWVMNHELVHVLATDKANKIDHLFRKLFDGKVSPIAENPLSMLYSYLTTPRWYSPRWYHEGIAVFMETWMSGGIGRAQNGYDEMVFRTMVLDDSYFYDVVGLESEGTTIDFQLGVNSYLYGTRFISYLVDQYGIDKLLQWYDRSQGSKRYFSNQFTHVYGNSLDDEWSQWITWEHKWQQANLDSIRLKPVTRDHALYPAGLGSVSRAYYDAAKRKLYVGVNHPGQMAHIAEIDIDRGEIRKICNVPTPALYYVAALTYDPSGNRLFFTTHNSTSWRDLNVVDIGTGKVTVLMRKSRIGDLAFNPIDKSIWGVRHHDGFSTLVRIQEPYVRFQEIIALKYGKDIFDIDISPDGNYLSASLVEINGRQSLIRWDITNLLKGMTAYEFLEEFEDNSPQNFVFSPDGKYLYGTSYYSGVSNIYRHDVESRNTSAITNCETGFFRPVPVSDDSLIVFRYSGQGFQPVMISTESHDIKAIKFLGNQLIEKYPLLKTWKLAPPSPDLIDLDTLKVASGGYHGLKVMKLASVYPIVEGYKDLAAYGVRFNFQDPLGGIDGIYFTAAYSPYQFLDRDEQFHFNIEYNHWNWKAIGSYNATDFYDLFGPTKTSRKGYSLALQYNNTLYYNKPKVLDYTIQLAGYGGLERLPDFQNIASSFDRFMTLSASLNYSHLFKSLGAVEYEQGTTWKLSSRANYVKSKVLPRLNANLDHGFLLPISHSSLWFRGSAGYSHGDRDEPFANYYFGGYGNNWIDYQDMSRYREYYSFPGVELNDIGGTNYGKFMVEWTLPPIRFRRFGVPSFYFRWARVALFSSAIATNIDNDSYRRQMINLGTQLDIRLVTWSLLNSTFSFGYALAFERDHKASNEFMISLKIL
ncbi:PD40 domain-containing protein [candidate division KSB1 bacterium]|nr:PD40 domain-containing protein [candidate division KSB1 bacterium]